MSVNPDMLGSCAVCGCDVVDEGKYCDQCAWHIEQANAIEARRQREAGTLCVERDRDSARDECSQ